MHLSCPTRPQWCPLNDVRRARRGECAPSARCSQYQPCLSEGGRAVTPSPKVPFRIRLARLLRASSSGPGLRCDGLHSGTADASGEAPGAADPEVREYDDAGFRVSEGGFPSAKVGVMGLSRAPRQSHSRPVVLSTDDIGPWRVPRTCPACTTSSLAVGLLSEKPTHVSPTACRVDKLWLPRARLCRCYLVSDRCEDVTLGAGSQRHWVALHPVP